MARMDLALFPPVLLFSTTKHSGYRIFQADIAYIHSDDKSEPNTAMGTLKFPYPHTNPGNLAEMAHLQITAQGNEDRSPPRNLYAWSNHCHFGNNSSFSLSEARRCFKLLNKLDRRLNQQSSVDGNPGDWVEYVRRIAVVLKVYWFAYENKQAGRIYMYELLRPARGIDWLRNMVEYWLVGEEGSQVFYSK